MKKENIPTSVLTSMGKMNENQKLPKPLIEKKRRARINRSLSDLRMQISDLLKKELMRTRSRRKSGKVEKADVLELAVQYIKEMKQEKSVQKELAFEQGYQMCQVNVDNYFRKVNELHKKQQASDEKQANADQWTTKPWMIQKDLLKTLDQQWTEHVQNTNYNRKMEGQRSSAFDTLPERAAEINDDQLKNQLAVDQAYIEKSAASNKLSQQACESSLPMNSNGSINEKMNHLTLQNLSSSSSSSKNDALFNSPLTIKKLFPTWKDKPLSKADELIEIKLYNETVMRNLNRNKSLCSSASSTSSCSSASSYAKTVNGLTHHNYPSSSVSSYCSINSSSSSTLFSFSQQEKKPSDIPSITLPKYSHYANSPFKKRKKAYQFAFDASSTLSDNVWRPW